MISYTHPSSLPNTITCSYLNSVSDPFFLHTSIKCLIINLRSSFDSIIPGHLHTRGQVTMSSGLIKVTHALLFLHYILLQSLLHITPSASPQLFYLSFYCNFPYFLHLLYPDPSRTIFYSHLHSDSSPFHTAYLSPFYSNMYTF